MAQTIKIKNSGTSSNTPSSLEHGELAINYADGKIFYKNSSNNIVEFANLSGSFLPLSGGSLTGNLSLGDNGQAIFGAGSDLTIFSNGSHGLIKAGHATADIRIESDSRIVLCDRSFNESFAIFNDDDDVKLFHDGIQKFATTSDGIQISGDISNATGDLTMDVVGDIILDADGGEVVLKDDGTSFGHLKGSTSDFIIQALIADKDIIFKGSDSDGESVVTALTLDMSTAGAATFNSNVTSGGFLQANGHISTGSNSGRLRAGASNEIEVSHNGSHGEIDVDTGNLTLDVAGDMTIDVGGGDILLKDDGTWFGLIANTSSDLVIKSIIQDKDIIFKGNDGGSNVDALRLDMSQAGEADFNSAIKVAGGIVAHQTNRGVLEYASNVFKMRSYGATSGSGSITLSTGGGGASADTVALTLDSNQNATFSGSVTLQSGNKLQANRADNARNVQLFCDNNFGTIETSTDPIKIASQVYTRFDTSGTERMRLNSTGLGIGTSSPTSKLHVSASPSATAPSVHFLQSGASNKPTLHIEQTGDGGNPNVTQGLLVEIAGTNDGSSKLIQAVGKNSNLNSGNDINAFTVTNGGNVGIGLANPAVPLDVHSNTSANAIRVRGRSSDNIGQITFTDSGGTARNQIQGSATYLNIKTFPSSPIAFFTGGTERARFDANGSLLIGSTTDSGANRHFFQHDGFFRHVRTNQLVGVMDRLSSNGVILQFRKDGSNVGNIGCIGDDILYIGTSDGTDAGLNFDGDNSRINPCNGGGVALDNTIDLGQSGARFKNLHLSGVANAPSVVTNNIYVAEDIKHTDDSDTYISFESNSQVFYSGGTRSIDLNPGSIVLNEGGGDQDFRVEGVGKSHLLFTDAANGRVGINISNPTQTLDVNGGANASARFITGNSAALFSQYNSGAVLWLDGSDGDFAGGDYFGIHAQSATDFYFSYASARIMTLTSGSLVGIGTSAPANKLHVYKGDSGHTWSFDGGDGFILENSDSLSINIAVPAANSGNILFSDADARGQGRISYTHHDDAMSFFTAGIGSERMRIHSNGAVGIGTTTTTGAGGLIVDNDIKTNSRYGVGSFGNVSNPAFYVLADTDTGIYFPDFNHIGLVTGGVERIRINNNGQFGIGETSVNTDASVEISKSAPNTGVTTLRLTNAVNNKGQRIDFEDDNGVRCFTLSHDNGNNLTYMGNLANESFAFYTNSAERMRLTSNGYLLVGKTTQGLTNAGFEVAQSGQASATQSSASCLRLNRLTSDGEILQLRKDGTTVGNIATVGGDLTIYSSASSHKGLRFGEGWIAPTANSTNIEDNAVDLGLTSARFKDAHFAGTINTRAVTVENDISGDATVRIKSTSQGDPTLIFNSSAANRSGLIKYQDNGTNVGRIEYVHSADRIDMRAGSATGITASIVNSAFLVGTTSVADTDNAITLRDDGRATFASNVSGTTIEVIRHSSGTAMEFVNTGGSPIVGSITVTGSATAYNTSSDARLKDNIEDADDSGKKIDAIQVRQFDWKSTGKHQDFGMVAQELLDVVPDAVTVPEDTDEMMSVDYSKLVPLLMKEIQQLRARVHKLEEEK